MPRPATDKRERLTAAALDLAYRDGFDRASITDIASAAGVAPGSVYYYFKTKQDVGLAIAGELGERYGAAMAGWETLEDPRDRLVAFIDSYRTQSTMVMEHGCPLGSVCTELSKHSPELGAAGAEVFETLVGWIASQFELLGYSAAASHARAIHLVSVMQGAAALSNALQSTEPLTLEGDHLERWVRNSGTSA
ncbi:TetR/AcrR family transcriptional regulator [Demequina activiva]|uniref:TetR family transcriptional regulator n=1 Tax=Demequina activiva TaxID=1582364 RepID=A0A919Q2V4_9MICO|nr:TetR/AcrR family transcriptional regulator [Demequina activiva]GIG55024.1 TetR family transcriptional regulator [Demequina activiva]